MAISNTSPNLFTVQAILTQSIRSELKTQGVLGHPEVTMTALSPVWLDSRSRYLRDMYR
ncbi:TPA: hypothetical protein J2F81_004725, partial [Escherichia coli]|nr:hypothetical protein [Escherichia coli]